MKRKFVSKKQAAGREMDYLIDCCYNTQVFYFFIFYFFFFSFLCPFVACLEEELYLLALYVWLICIPYMYALYVCLICMPYMYGLCVCLTPCLICMPYMYALCVCLIVCL